MTERPPTLRERRLAAELRRLREQAEMTLDQAAERLDCSRATLARMETARRRLKVSEVQALLDLYQPPQNHAERLLVLARGARTRGWWDVYSDNLPSGYGTYIELEAEAAAIHTYEALLIQGLLQTEEYAREVIRAGAMQLLPPAEIERRNEVRRMRQAVLTDREPPLRLWCVLDEGALSRQVGGATLMKAQYRRLAEMAERPNVSIQVMPYAAGAHAATAGSFSIIGFPGRDMPDVASVETQVGTLYIEEDVHVHRYALAFDRLRADALGIDESAALITRLAGG